MRRFFIFIGADKEKPGSGFIEKEFEAETDAEAISMAKRHYEGSGYTVWAYNGVNHNAHIQFRFVDYIDGPPKPKEKQRGSGATAG